MQEKRNDYSEVTPEIRDLSKLCFEHSTIDPTLYTKYQVNRGLRDINGNGVLTGLTEISEIQSNKIVNGEKMPCEGRLFFRGVDIQDIVHGLLQSIVMDLKKLFICFYLERCLLCSSYGILRNCLPVIVRCQRILCGILS